MSPARQSISFSHVPIQPFIHNELNAATYHSLPASIRRLAWMLVVAGEQNSRGPTILSRRTHLALAFQIWTFEVSLRYSTSR